MQTFNEIANANNSITVTKSLFKSLSCGKSFIIVSILEANDCLSNKFKVFSFTNSYTLSFPNFSNAPSFDSNTHKYEFFE